MPVTNIYPNVTNPSERKITFEIKGKAFHAHLKDAMELTAEMLVRSNYTDTKRLYEILTELKSRLQSSMISAGHTIAAGRAMSYTSETVAIQEILSGMDFYRLVDGLCTNWDEEKEKLPEILKRLSECMVPSGKPDVLILPQKRKNRKSCLKRSQSTEKRFVYLPGGQRAGACCGFEEK